MKRVLLMTGPLSLRGTTLYTISLARELKLRGHRVAVLCPGGLFEDSLEELRVPLYQVPVHFKLWRDLLYLGPYCEAVRSFDADLLHVQHQDLATIGSIVAHRTRRPMVVTVHGQVEEPLRFPLGGPPRAIAVSEDVRQSLVTAGQMPRDRIDVSPNGVSASLSSLDVNGKNPDHLPVVGTVNRIAPGRGIDVLLRAARRVLDQGHQAYFLVLGEGPAERDVRKLAQELELTPHLTFALPRARVADLFRPMTLYVSASHAEGHGIFLLSAMAEARPVISTRVGGVLSFLRDGENGLLVPRGDVEALAAAICRLLADREESRRLAVNGFRDVREGYPLATMVERTVSSYEKA